MKKAVFVCLLCSFLLTSCGKTDSAEDFFDSFSTGYALPYGLSYRKTEKASESDFLSVTLFDTLYATAPETDYYTEFNEAIVWLGTSGERACEMGVFVCPDRESAEEIAFMCRARIALLSSLKEQTDVLYTESARAAIYGKTVFYSVLPDNEAAHRLARRILN